MDFNDGLSVGETSADWRLPDRVKANVETSSEKSLDGLIFDSAAHKLGG
jgi:hypothetical protein